jgi:hypothetical protein
MQEMGVLEVKEPLQLELEVMVAMEVMVQTMAMEEQAVMEVILNLVKEEMEGINAFKNSS